MPIVPVKKSDIPVGTRYRINEYMKLPEWKQLEAAVKGTLAGVRYDQYDDGLRFTIDDEMLRRASKSGRPYVQFRQAFIKRYPEAKWGYRLMCSRYEKDKPCLYFTKERTQ